MDDVIDVSEITAEAIRDVYDLTDRMKADPDAFGTALTNRTLLMLFAKPSTRTRVSFEAGTTELGGHAIYFSQQGSQLERGESLKDTAKVLSRYTGAIMARLFEHESVLELAEHADIPVINGLTDLLHPCQALADLYTLREKEIEGPLAYVGDGNNVAHSLMQTCATLGRPCRVATPPDHQPAAEIRERVADADVTVTTDPHEAVEGAGAVYTDVWVSMGDDGDREEALSAFGDYRVDADLMSLARDDAVFMHCLPAHRGEEMTAEVIDGPQSVVYDQAENRQHVQKAILHELMTGDAD